MNTIDIEVNDETRKIASATTLQQFVDALALAEPALALAVNRCVVPRQQWPGYVLQQRDRIDIVRAIGGG